MYVYIHIYGDLVERQQPPWFRLVFVRLSSGRKQRDNETRLVYCIDADLQMQVEKAQA